MAKKERLDIILTDRGYFPSRSKAKRAVMAGEVYVDGQIVDKAGTAVDRDASIKIKGRTSLYVSRGGLKLKKALSVFEIDARGKKAIDIGASTGGFTDCLLQHGASRVYAVDVGYGQLAWKLRQDERVEVIERTNFRYLTREELDIAVPLIVTDVSFISLKLIIPAALQFLEEKGDIAALIKPQFEAGPEQVGKNGVVRDDSVHLDVIKDLSYFFHDLGLCLIDLDFSPITGASSKNIEFLIHLKKDRIKEFDFSNWFQRAGKIVRLAHQQLGRG